MNHEEIIHVLEQKSQGDVLEFQNKLSQTNIKNHEKEVEDEIANFFGEHTREFAPKSIIKNLASEEYIAPVLIEVIYIKHALC